MFLTGLEVTASVGVLAFAGGMLSLWQKALTDRRTAWWTRAQWAMDKSLSEDPATRRIGAEAMLVLASDSKGDPLDLEVLDAALTRALDIT